MLGVLETAKALNAPVIIQFSNGGAQFNAGKGLKNGENWVFRGCRSRGEVKGVILVWLESA